MKVNLSNKFSLNLKSRGKNKVAPKQKSQKSKQRQKSGKQPKYFGCFFRSPKTMTFISLLFILVFGAVAGERTIDFAFRNKIFPSVSVGNVALGKLTIDEAQQKLQTMVDDIKEEGLTFCYSERCIIIDSLIIAPEDPDLSYELISMDIDKTIASAYLIGRHGNTLERLAEQIRILKNGVTIPVCWRVDNKQLNEILMDNFSDVEKPARNTDIQITKAGINSYNVTIKPAATGWRLDYNQAVADAKVMLNRLENPNVKLTRIIDRPTIINVNEADIIDKVNKILDGAHLKMTYQEKEWDIKREQLISSLTLQMHDGKIKIALHKNGFNELLEEISADLEQPAQDAKFILEDNRVVEFQGSQDGLTINRALSWQRANALFINATSSWALELPLLVDVTPSSKPTELVNDLGIKEIIGIGSSNFSGSPVNRRHNIKVGADTLNGLLILPDQEFSLVKALGRIDSNNGYLPELVIKGNKTIPEYGGGLCQIGTTTFRAALASGLPIAERQNHSYRVPYYEPAGTDATIYNPKPDLRFINDTGSYILIQTKVDEDELIFEFWGMSDGRIIEQTKPIIYNITSPGPTKYIETTDLLPGKIKCTERAHKGADTAFDYRVSYPNGEVKEETFVSHYRAWQEVCLIGIEEEELLPEENGDNQTETQNEDDIVKLHNLTVVASDCFALRRRGGAKPFRSCPTSPRLRGVSSSHSSMGLRPWLLSEGG